MGKCAVIEDSSNVSCSGPIHESCNRIANWGEIAGCSVNKNKICAFADLDRTAFMHAGLARERSESQLSESVSSSERISSPCWLSLGAPR